MFTDDKDIERELAAALNVTPSDDFETRVQRRVEEERPPRRLVAPVWLASAAALVVIAVAWMLVSRQGGEIPQPIVVTTTDPLPSRPTTPDVELPLVSLSGSPVRRTAAREPARRIPEPGPIASEPEIIVPAGQLALIQRLVREANAGRVTVPEAFVEPPPELPELIVPPVIIEPIPVAGREPSGGAFQRPQGLQ